MPADGADKPQAFGGTRCWAREQVQAWPQDLSELDVTEEFGRIVAAASNPWTA